MSDRQQKSEVSIYNSYKSHEYVCMSLNLTSKLPTTKDKSLNEQTNGQINDDNTTKEAN